MFRPVSSKPDLVAQEYEILDLWRERRTFARLRAQNAGGPRWSFLDGPITANNPMGVHHAWGRAYKDLYQRFHAMLGEEERYQNGFDCQGLWVEVNVERDLGFTSKRDIEAFGIARFVTLCKQRVLTYAARQTEQSIRLGMWMDWNDPDELRRLEELLGTDPSRVTTIEGPHGPVTDTVEMLVGRLGMPDTGGSYFTFSNENNDLIWGFLAECHRRGWIYKGHDTMPWCARCGTGISQTEMNEGYQDRDDPGLTVRFPLIDRPGESLLVWTTTPWTLTSNVAAAVGPTIRYVRVRQGDQVFWLGKGTLKTALTGPFEVLDEVSGSEMVGWRYAGPFDDLPAVRHAFAGGTADDPDRPYEHRVVPWTEVGEDEGTGIVHIAPGCGAEDFQLGKALGLPVIAPLDEGGIFLDGFGPLSGRDVRDVADPIIEHLKREDRFYRLETITHRYPHCWRCGTPLVFRLVDEWFISMGPLYDQPRASLTPEQVDASLRYQIMDVVDQIRWIPDFGYERELDWLRNMHDWMISKKRYWGLALPIYDCAACGTVEVIGGREELHDRAVSGWEEFEGHTPHRPYVDAVRIACPTCGAAVERIKDVGNPWLDAGIVPFSTLHFREDPDYWRQWFPADFITESFPGQFRNWFYSMLAMSTVLRREPPFKTIFGYALVFAEDGRQMHKSWGNAIEFDEAADRMGVDVMRWMFAKARPEENILFGWHAADEARRELLILWNVYSFFVTYARLAGWSPDRRDRAAVRRPRRSSTAGSCPGRRGRRRRPKRGSPTSTRSVLRARCRPISMGCRRGTCACRVAASRGPTTGPTRPRRSRRSMPRSWRPPGCSPRSCRSSPNRCTGTWSRRSTPTRPTASTSRAGRAPNWRPSRRAARGVDGGRPGRRRPRPDAAEQGPPQDPPAAGDRLDRAPGPRAGDRRGPARLSPTRSTSRGRRHRRRLGARRAAGQAAAPEDRQAARIRDPRGDGRGPRGRGRLRVGRVGDPRPA